MTSAAEVGRSIALSGIHAPKSSAPDPEPWTDDGYGDGHQDEPRSSLLAGMVNGAWLDAQEFPPLVYAVPGVIPEGFGLLVGPPKAGKSWLVADIGLAVAAGGKALGRIAVTRRPVLYLALEDGHRRLQSRFRRIMANGPIPAGMHVIVRAQSHEVIAMVGEFLALHNGQPALIILDTLGKVKPPNRAGGDSYAADYAIGTRLKSVIDNAPGSSLLVVHHSRKAESTDFVDAVSGTQGIAGSADFVMVLARKRHSSDAVLAVTGRDIAENEYAMVTDNGLWTLDGADLMCASGKARERREEGSLGDRTLDVLAFINSRRETRPADLGDIGIDSKQAPVYLKRLADSERIRKIGRGVYGPGVDPDQLSLDGQDSMSVISVMSVISDESSQVEASELEAEKITPPVMSVILPNPDDSNGLGNNTNNTNNSGGESVRPSGGNAVLQLHDAVFGYSERPVRAFKVGEPHPYAQWETSVSVEFIEPRKRKWLLTSIKPDNTTFAVIEADGRKVYDSRDDVPCDMDKWNATSERFADRRPGRVTYVEPDPDAD